MKPEVYERLLRAAGRLAANLEDSQDMLHETIRQILESANRKLDFPRVLFMLRSYGKLNMYVKPYRYQVGLQQKVATFRGIEFAPEVSIKEPYLERYWIKELFNKLTVKQADAVIKMAEGGIAAADNNARQLLFKARSILCTN